MIVVRDFRGIPIHVGSRIVYPVRQGSSMWLCEAEVREVGEDYLVVSRLGSPGRNVWITRIDRVVVVR